jgi:hypothetical protein
MWARVLPLCLVMRSFLFTFVALSCALTGACSGDVADEEVDESGSGVGDPRKDLTHWQPQSISPPNGIGTYEGESGNRCTGGLQPGVIALGERVKKRFDGITEIGGYSCRPRTSNPSKISLHGFGRALDVMTVKGEPIANYLIANSRALGVQLVIWRGTMWKVTKSGPSWSLYGGPSPHVDHVHVELTRAAAAGTIAAANTSAAATHDEADEAVADD